MISVNAVYKSGWEEWWGNRQVKILLHALCKNCLEFFEKKEDNINFYFQPSQILRLPLANMTKYNYILYERCVSERSWSNSIAGAYLD